MGSGGSVAKDNTIVTSKPNRGDSFDIGPITIKKSVKNK